MATPFPHQYLTTITRTSRSRARIDAASRTSIAGGAPPEFGGDAASWSPEHLLLAAVGLCLETTFDALAAREHLEVDAWSARTSGTLDRTAAGLAFTSFTVTVDLKVAAADLDRARVVLDRAKRACIVSAALCVPVEVIANVEPTSLRILA